jgi:pimeloyl-ACP methyl ester carboxylesterase
MQVYLLPGLGTDRRLYSRLDLQGMPIRFLEWPDYKKGESLGDIAARLSEQVDQGSPHVLCGVSMGGMVAQELAALTAPRLVVLISSWTGPHEWPWTVKLGAALGVQRVITDATMRGTWPVKQWLVGQGNAEVDRLLYEMACEQGAGKVRSGLEAIFRWKGSPWQGPLVRIHGERDRVTPLRFPVEHRVPGGNHSMVIHKPSEVGAALRKLLSEHFLAP